VFSKRLWNTRTARA